MNLFGNFEALLHSRFPELELVVRNFGRPADEVGDRQRSGDYTRLDDPLAAFGPDTFLCFFGYNESFAEAGGVANYAKLSLISSLRAGSSFYLTALIPTVKTPAGK